MELYPIFPLVIGKVKIEEHELIKKKYAPRIIDQFKTCPNEKAPWANQCNTWQVNADNQLNEVFTKYFEKYLKFSSAKIVKGALCFFIVFVKYSSDELKIITISKFFPN